MNENPYSAPDSPILETMVPNDLATYNFKQIKELYSCSANIRALNFLWILSALLTTSMLFVVFAENPDIRPEDVNFARVIVIAIAAFQYTLVIGIAKRTYWGRTLGIIVCFFMLIGFPLGTLLGAVGASALSRGRILFGPNRLTHKEVKTAFKQIKKAGK